MSLTGTTRKISQPRERRLIVEYVRAKFPSSTALFNVKLGGIPAKLAGADITGFSHDIAKPWARYADALVIIDEKLIVIEAKLPAKLEAVAQLLFYKGLIPKTPLLGGFANMRIELRIVTALPDPDLVQFAQSHGITVDIYQPQWAVEYLTGLLKGVPASG